MLCTVGDLLEDVVVWLERDPVRGTDTDVRIERRRGGSAANVAAFAAGVGCAARFLGQVGDDRTGAGLIADLAASGVDAVVTQRGRTGCIVVLVDSGGERSFLTDRAAATQLSAVPEGSLRGVRALHVPAYSLVVEPLATTTYALVGEATAAGIAVTIDASSASVLGEFGVDEFLELIRNLEPSVLFCNRDEATLLGLGERDAARGAQLTVVKNGSGPTVLIRADGAARTVAVPPVESVRDTTGAGDAFAAGFLAVRLSGRDSIAATEAGHRLAARVLGHAGASVS